MHSLVAPEKPPRVNTIKAVNELDAAQLTMSSTIVNSNKTNDNDNTAVTKNTSSLTRQLSVDKAATTKRKHLHFHSPLVKGPMKMATMQQQEQQQQQRVEQYPDPLFANIMSDNTWKANAIITTTRTKAVQTMETSNITPTTFDHHDNNDDNYSNAHHSYEHHGRVSKAMSLKDTKTAAVEAAEAEVEVRATGNSNASTRLDRGCTSLMYACQHGDISEVMAQLSNKVSYYTCTLILSNFLSIQTHAHILTVIETIQMLNNE